MDGDPFCLVSLSVQSANVFFFFLETTWCFTSWRDRFDIRCMPVTSGRTNKSDWLMWRDYEIGVLTWEVLSWNHMIFRTLNRTWLYSAAMFGKFYSMRNESCIPEARENRWVGGRMGELVQPDDRHVDHPGGLLTCLQLRESLPERLLESNAPVELRIKCSTFESKHPISSRLLLPSWRNEFVLPSFHLSIHLFFIIHSFLHSFIIHNYSFIVPSVHHSIPFYLFFF